MLEKDRSDKILVKFGYDPLRVQEIKTIPGHKWYPKEKYWSFPDNNGTLEKILKTFEGEEIYLDPALQANKIPSPLAGEGKGEGDFQDLRRELHELLGHAHSKTTEICTHVSTKSLGKIKSPLDSLELKKGGND